MNVFIAASSHFSPMPAGEGSEIQHPGEFVSVPAREGIALFCGWAIAPNSVG